MNIRKSAIAIIVIIIAVLAYRYTENVLTISEREGLIVLVIAAGLWTTEAVPLVATSILIPLMQALLGVQSFKGALSPFFDTVVMLLLGGFLLAVAVSKHDLDEYFAYRILSKLKADARVVVLVFMLITGFLSMWISNTASAALMLTIALRLTEKIKGNRKNLPKIMVLGVAYSATAGGLSTLVGTTTCAMAAGSLKDLIGYDLNFLSWIALGFPIALLMISVIWVVLLRIFPVEGGQLPQIQYNNNGLNKHQKLTLGTFLVAIILWLTSKLPEPVSYVIGWSGHGLSSSIVAGLIAVTLLILGIIDETDVPKANWNSLLLIGGGLSLGKSMEVSGLASAMSNSLFNLTGGQPEIVTIGLVVAFGLGISIIASNTASAGLFLPIAIGLGNSTNVSPVILAVAVGISTSLDFMLPVGTPPNAIAYSTGKVTMREMIKAGIILDIVGALLTIVFAHYIWPYLI